MCCLSDCITLWLCIAADSMLNVVEPEHWHAKTVESRNATTFSIYLSEQIALSEQTSRTPTTSEPAGDCVCCRVCVLCVCACFYDRQKQRETKVILNFFLQLEFTTCLLAWKIWWSVLLGFILRNLHAVPSLESVFLALFLCVCVFILAFSVTHCIKFFRAKVFVGYLIYNILYIDIYFYIYTYIFSSRANFSRTPCVTWYSFSSSSPVLVSFHIYTWMYSFYVLLCINRSLVWM